MKFLLFVLFLLPNPDILACASCGSGGGFPLVLYPNENQKVFVGLSRSSFESEIGTLGQTYSSSLRHQDISQLSYMQRIRSKFQLGIASNFVTNRKSSGTQYSLFGDPSLAVKWNVLTQSFVRPFRPQIQLIQTYKPQLTRSILDSKRRDGLDAIGSGYAEWDSGIDFWWGMTEYKFGFVVSHKYTEPRFISNRQLGKRSLFSFTATFGRYLSKEIMLTTGWSSSQGAKRTIDGQVVENSEKQSNDPFLTMRYYVTPLQELRLSMRQTAAFGKRQNATRSLQYGVSYARTI